MSVSVSGTGHFNADGRLAFIDFACEDVTERRRLEAELAHAQKVEALGRLAGGVAHDFNNLLTAIIGYQQMLLDGLPEGSPGRQPAEEIGRAAEAHRADIVALSFSTAFPQRRIPALLQQLCVLLPATCELWAGGGGVARVGKMDGVVLLPALDDAVRALAGWRAAHS